MRNLVQRQLPSQRSLFESSRCHLKKKGLQRSTQPWERGAQARPIVNKNFRCPLLKRQMSLTLRTTLLFVSAWWFAVSGCNAKLISWSMIVRMFFLRLEQKPSLPIGRVVMKEIASLLVGGYYLPASEIERRLQICSSNFYADPGKPPRSGKLISFYGFCI